MTNEFFIEKEYARATELRDVTIDQSGLRVYRSSPEGLTIQMRTNSSLGQTRGGVKRNVISGCELSHDEALQLRDRLDAFIKRQD